MPFPDQSRVKYEQNPLVEVACQLTFSSGYSADDNNFVDDSMKTLHEQVMGVFPLFNIGKSVTVDYKLEDQQLLQQEESIYEFSTLDQKSKITLSRNSVTLTTKEYESWEEFRKMLFHFVDVGLYKTFPSKHYSRVGLRYKDVIARDQLGLTGTSWSKLLNSQISSLHQPDSGLSEIIAGEKSTFSIILPENKGMLQVNYGLVTNNNTKEVCFLVDSDFFNDGDMNDAEARDCLDAYNIKARNFFRWCIRDELHSALKPRAIKNG